MKEIELDGKLLVYKKGYSLDFVRSVIQSRGLQGLRIFSILKEDQIPDLNFLKDYTFLQTLHITGNSNYDYSFLLFLKDLKDLAIYNYEGDNIIDLRNQKKLKELSLAWRKDKIIGIEKCVNLKKLSLVEYKEENFLPITTPNIEFLQVKTSTIRSDKGIENLKRLKTLDLGNCTRLRTFDYINHLKELKILKLDGCRKIEDYSPLGKISSLEELKIVDCKDVNSLYFILELPLLSKFSLLGSSNVVNGDLNPLKNIREVFYRHREHYNIKIETPKQDDIIRHNLEKIKNMFK